MQDCLVGSSCYSLAKVALGIVLHITDWEDCGKSRGFRQRSTGVGVATLEAKKEDGIEESDQSLGMERGAGSTPAPALPRMSNLPC